MRAVAALVLFVAAVNADPLWDGLRVTWMANALNPWAFDSIAREAKSLSRSYKLRDNQCNAPNAKFLGKRYWYNEDPALTILYDVNGIVAGIQTSVPKSDYTPSNDVIDRNFADDGDYWTLTAYFVDPRLICTSGRTKEQLEKEGTGTGLWLQTGSDPLEDLMSIPLTEEAAKQTAWKLGKCFYTMGVHYWYNVTKDMECGKFFPNCIMYNKGKLTAFCFSINANLPSKRYEHPTAEQAKMFINPVPDCFATDPSYNPSSTIHVYFDADAVTSSWC